MYEFVDRFSSHSGRNDVYIKYMILILLQKYKQSKLVETCKMKRIPIIQKEDVVVTRTMKQGPFVGQVCEAQLTLPDGRKVCF